MSTLFASCRMKCLGSGLACPRHDVSCSGDILKVTITVVDSTKTHLLFLIVINIRVTILLSSWWLLGQSIILFLSFYHLLLYRWIVLLLPRFKSSIVQTGAGELWYRRSASGEVAEFK